MSFFHRRDAPLASMEDISAYATPMSTPGPTPGGSPKTRARWSYRSSSGSLYEPLLINPDPEACLESPRKENFGPPMLSSTPSHPKRPLHVIPETGEIPKRFGSPARDQLLLRKAVVTNGKQHIPRHYSRRHQPAPLFLQQRSPNPSPKSSSRSIEGKNGDLYPLETRVVEPIQDSEKVWIWPTKKAWNPSEFSQEESARILDPEKDEILGKNEKQVQFVTPRRFSPPKSERDSRSILSDKCGHRICPTDELYFYGGDVSNPPSDRWNLIYLTLVLHGVGTLMPWNMFITAKEYFVDYKLGKDYTGADILYATYFLQYIGFAAQVPNVIFNWINVFLNASGTLTSRIVWTLLVEVIIFVITISLAMIDSSKWPGIFFYITLFSVIILNMVNGIYQNTIYGLAAKLPFKYTGAVVLGSNLSGTIVALVNIISIAMAPNPRTAAIYYFITALFILLACFDTYFALPLNRFFRYHDHMYNQALQEKRNRSVIHAIPYWNVFKKCFPQCFNVFFTFFVTLTIFPAIFADIAQVDESFFIPKRYFSALTCFLTFNLSAVFGNLIPSIFKWPSPRWLFAPILLRFFFIPFFLLCNFRPIGVERLWPVLIHWDWAYWIGGALMGLTNGYFSSMAMMLCPRSVEPEYASTAGMFGAASIVTGIFSGIGFSYLMPVLVSHPDFNFEEPSWWPHFVG
ncbi:equilibrative nucleoside transporter 1-like isoform X4 [Tigriopus californicus]|uniref:equilibrative nucleoside transporter 1-like isoform X4 n=1 Tax=Tigriopus californicus TaxID=6832 RepID=UPI0027DAB013|nr:equilibrative nucleoside transporter 1-like isoform X4 [Tigriopus californicus]